MKISSFFKISGSGNDFIMIDNRGGQKRPPREYIEKICARGTGIGADVLIMLEKSDKQLDFKMVYFNSDGREADMCGNGGRSIVLFAKLIGAVKTNKVLFESKKAVHRAEIKKGNIVKIELQKPHSLKTNVSVSTKGGIVKGGFINTGVPHFVTVVKDIEKTDVVGLGREIRHSESFSKEGANVNFVQFKNNLLHIRTYERGVESETLACGTGSVASAIIFSISKNQQQPIKLLTRSKEILTVYLDRDFANVWLEGKVTLVFKGTLCL
ncbi:MAG: diaminopimelate epimerase [bacterium]|nr:diaminopimelate epimerase [bacterium]